MKKRFLSCAAVIMLMVFLSVGSVFAADDAGKNFTSNKVGVGYQGFFGGDLLNGVSARGWIGNRVGLEVNGFYGRVSIDGEDNYGKYDALKADLWMLEAKAMFAFVVRSNSKFYAGGKVGYGQIGMTDTSINHTSFWSPGLFVGAEWNFPQIPELGFNFDAGYQWFMYENNVSSSHYEYINVDISGINTTFGIHYYF